MNKYFLAFLFVAMGLAFSSPVLAVEKIDSFDANIKVNQDASLNVSEKIQYNFGEEQRHGIFRDVPIKYKARGGNYNLRVSDISVADENGVPCNFTTTYPGNDVEIKIGDADKYVSGKKTYVINYKIKKAINYFDDHDELYWNATGNGWPVFIEKSSVRVSLDGEIKGDIQKTCYVGLFGSNNPCKNESIASNSQEAYFTYGTLNPGEGMTVVFGFPVGVVTKPTAFQVFLETLKDNGILFLPISVFFFMFYFWYRWGRDPKGRGTIVAEYSAPDNIKPIEAGTVIDNSSDHKDISAEIVNLAVEGYIKITKTKEKKIFSEADYELEKLKPEDDLENPFDVKIMESLFGGKTKIGLNDLKNKFYKKISEINDLVCESTIKRGYYASNPNSVLFLSIGIGIGVGVVGSIILGSLFGVLGTVSAMISGAIIIVFGIMMPARTKKGVLAKEHILGLKEYLSVAEKDRINFHNAPEKNPEHFEKLLPYAMVLGVEKAWAEQFKDIYLQNPSWYNDSTGANFNSLVLVSSLNSISTSANSTLASSPSSASSGGSGFSGGGSGGGFGGGGGGSW